MSESPSSSPRQQNVISDRVQPRLRTVRWLMVATALLAGLSLLTAFPLMNIGACMSWPLALAAAGMCFTAFVRARTPPAEQFTRTARGGVGLLLATCFVMVIGSTCLNMVVLRVTRDASKSTIPAANLKALGLLVEQHAEMHAAYPPSLESIISEYSMSPKALLSPFDPDAPHDVPGDRLIYSSYVYRPGNGKPAPDPDIVIAHEREPFTICEPRILAPKERWVLFGDGQVRHLTDAEFADAMRKDEERRRELGWSTSTGPAAPSPAQPEMRL